MIPARRARTTVVPVNGFLLWGLVLPILLVVAGVVTILRRRNGR